MTGYGQGRACRDGRELTAEVKTVNHRFLDVSFRLPRHLGFLEEPIRKMLSGRMQRGHVDVTLSYRNSRADARAVAVDAALLAAYRDAFSRMRQTVRARNDMTLSAYARLPDVLTVTESEEDREAVIALLAEAMTQALDEACATRAAEGEALRRDMGEKLAHIEALAGQVATRAPQVVQAYKEKLNARVAELLSAPADPQRLAQEVAVFADKCAIDEELVRLCSHAGQIRETFASPEAVGRRLDFLIQELNREVNTIGSKASDATIAAWVVDAKADIEKLREQIQNIE
jgi:uncharacterized protein (TIGR00255 family)